MSKSDVYDSVSQSVLKIVREKMADEGAARIILFDVIQKLTLFGSDDVVRSFLTLIDVSRKSPDQAWDAVTGFLVAMRLDLQSGSTLKPSELHKLAE